MKSIGYPLDSVKSILLNHRYSNGNIPLLLKHTELLTGGLSNLLTMKINLPEDHWAFTHLEEPVRFVVDDHSAQVRDTNTGEWVASFATRGAAINYAEILNSR